jgi:fibronectin type 3 domain-containing protein
VERSPDGSTGWTAVGTTASGQTSLSDTTVSAGSTYFYRVFATNGGGDSPPSVTVSATPAPTAPTGVTATAMSQSEIDLSWTASAGASGYRVERSPDGSTGWTAVGTPTGTSFADINLAAATTYYYRVFASNAGGDSAPSTVVPATTLALNVAAAPTNVAATVVSSSRVDVSWTGSSGATGYRVERSPNGSTGWTAVGTTASGQTSLSDTTVSAGNSYFYRVIATNGGGDSPPSVTVSVTLAPDAPAGLTASAPSQTEVDLSWTASTGAAGYRVERSPDGSTGWSGVGTSTGTSFADINLTPATTYYYRVFANNSAGDSASSTVVSATTKPVPPAAPTNVAATVVSSSRVDVSWTGSSGATGYRVERSPDGSTGWTAVGTTASGQTSLSDTTVSAGSTYFYRVFATNGGGDSPPSVTVSATPAPTAPTGVTATAMSQSEIDLSWTASAGASGYRVERSPDGSTGWTAVGTPTGTSFADINLAAATTYYYRVFASNAGGDSAPSTVVSATTPSGLATPPTALHSGAVTASRVDLAWTDSAGETGYRVERSPDGTTGWAALGTTAANVTAFSDLTVSPAASYYYRVFATNGVGDSAPSNVLLVTTLPNPPAAPTGVTLTVVSASRLDVSWTASAGATGYRVERSADGSSGWTAVGTTSVTSFSDTGLTAATTYYYRVVASNTGGDSGPSAVVSGATLPLPPASPGVVAAAASSSEIDVRWSLVTGATSYLLEVSTTGTSGWTTLATVGATVGSFAHVGLPPSTTYFYRVTSSNSGGSSAPSSTASATTVSRTCPCSIWTSANTPTIAASADGSANELGVKFRTDVSGVVSGVRFYKGSTNTGTHVGHLWSRTGTLLATATFSNETATGWQQVLFSTPVTVTAGTTYVVSYWAPVGHYSVDNNYFTSTGRTNAPLTALAAGVDGVNAVYRQGSSAFPTSSYLSSNYWVDVVFTPTAPPAPAGLTIGTVTSSSVPLSWADGPSETSYRVERSSDGVSNWVLVGSTVQNVTTYTDVALAASTTYYYRVIAINGGGSSPPSAVVPATTAPG